VKSCPSCRLRFDRGEDDYFLGGFTVNFVGAELTIAGIGLAAIWSSWPDVPWNAIKYGLLLTMTVVPIVSYPVAKMLWLAIDLGIRPAGPEDFLDPEDLSGAPTLGSAVQTG